ncbi:MAG: NDP-sugar synthase [Candidatus Bathyarchaeota archaeon]|nr:NDP-sugar synthase [Candidatus Bathyarchaeota archaeon]
MILAGGFATRLRPLSCARPKTLFPIVNKPLLQWIFERLARNGVDEAILAVNALTQFYIRQQRPPKCGLKVKFSIDPPKMPLGTAGPIKKAEQLIGHSEPFIVLNGDIFADINYRELLAEHKKLSALATIALCKVEDPCSFGVAELNGEQIKRFIEKPAKGEAPSNLINAGAYVLSPKVFDYIPQGRAVSIEREVFPKLAAEGKLYGYCINGLWMDIGKPEEYIETNKVILDSIANSLKQKNAEKFEVKKPIALDGDVSVGEKSVIGPYAIIGKNTKVGKKVHISNSVVFADVEIGDFATLNGAIVGEGARVGKNVKLSEGCIVGDQAKIKDGVHLPEGLAICPAKEVSENVLKPKIDCKRVLS